MSKTKEEIELEKQVFGDFQGFHEELENLDLENDGLSDSSASSNSQEDDELFYVDKDGSHSEDSVLSDSDSSLSDADVPRVWHDEDDEQFNIDLTSTNRTRKLRKSLDEPAISGLEYESRLRSQFEKFYQRPKWATTDAFDSDSDVDMDLDESVNANPLRDVLERQTSYLNQTSTKLLPTSDLNIQRLADVTKQTKCQSVVQCIDFHPKQPLLLSCGYDRTLRIFEIDGKNNKICTSLYIENSPFKTAKFHPDGKRVFAAGRRKYLFIWDLETGFIEKVNRLYGHESTIHSFEKFEISPDGLYLALFGIDGYVNFLSGSTGMWVASAKIEGDLADLSWRGDCVVIASTQGRVYEFDIKTDKFSKIWQDMDLVGVSKLVANQRYTAIGLESGIVSIYENVKVSAESARPVATINNLVTRISSLVFSNDGQMLVVASRVARDALRIVHLPSFSVFKNWPTSATPLGHVSTVTFSPQNQMLAAGNEGGFIRLWSLNHYT